MVDVGDKAVTCRRALASGDLVVTAAQMQRLVSGQVAKGDWQSVARVGGVMAAKRCAEWIPLCHPIALEQVEVEVTLAVEELRVHVSCLVSTHAKTGVEMEALCGVTAALLCVYDMIKGEGRGAHITQVRLDEKSGGRTGDWVRT
jgi:cyclic pyranopterin phosphate synthase